LTSTGDGWVPTEAGRLALIEHDLVDLIAGVRRAADDDDWGECEDRPTPEKLHRIADGLEELRPIDSMEKAYTLCRRLEAYGLDRPAERR
jgi:hypothetical protein